MEDPSKKSYNAYQLLFKLASFRGVEGYHHKRIEENQSIVLGFLIERILRSFDKIKGGKNRDCDIEEIKFVLKQMMGLKIKPKILSRLESILVRAYMEGIKSSSIVLQLEEGHIFFFQPLVAKCLRCEDG